MIILVFYASHGMSQEHYVSYIDINNTGQFARQISNSIGDENVFYLTIETNCFNSKNCGGIVLVGNNGVIIDSTYFINFSTNLSALSSSGIDLFLTGEFNMGSANEISVLYLDDRLMLKTIQKLIAIDSSYYNYFATATCINETNLRIGGSAFCGESCQDGLFFNVNLKTEEVKFKTFRYVENGYTAISFLDINDFNISSIYLFSKDFTTDKDSIRIVRLDTAFNQTFEWSMEVNDNAIPRGCVTRNEDMIITIPDEGLGNRRDLWAIDTTGQVKWKWKWSENSGRTNILRVKEAENGDLLVMGQVNGYEDYLGDIRNTAFVMRLTPDGKQKWIRYFKIADPDTRLSNYVSDLAELDNGDLQLTGQSRRIIFDADIGEYRPDQDIFWARIGGDGCINGDCSEVYTITDTQEVPIEKGGWARIYPNPTNTATINIHLSKSAGIQLIGMSGKKYQTASFDEGTHIIGLENIGEAILLIRCTDNEGNSSVEKLVRL